jgi:hypothetical protein
VDRPRRKDDGLYKPAAEAMKRFPPFSVASKLERFTPRKIFCFNFKITLLKQPVNGGQLF